MPSSKLFSQTSGAPGGGAFIGGSGTAEQVAVFSGASTIGGSADLTWDGQELFVQSTTGGLGINASTSSGVICTIRRDQNAPTRSILTNGDTGASVTAQYEATTDAGALVMGALSVATGAYGSIFTDSGFTNGLRIGTNGTRNLELRTNNTVCLTANGSTQEVVIASRLGVEAGNATDSTARIRGQSNSGTNQYGLIVDTIHQSSATSTGYTIDSQVATASAAFTMSVGVAYQASAANKGAGSTITRLTNFGGVIQTAGTNNAFIADNTSYSGNFFISSVDTNPSSFAGQVRVASLGVGNSAAATTPGTVVSKIEVFNASGVSLGFLPVYDAIT